MLKHHPVVSVCVPTCNRARMLRESIESVLEQTFQDFELVISDNASQDETSSVVRSYGDPRIRYVRNERNVGHRENMNQCLRLARGHYISILPDDDIMMPENLWVKVDVLARHDNVGLVHSKYHVIDEHGRIVKYNTNEGHREDRAADALEKGQDVLTAMLLSSNIVNSPTVLFRRECYEKLGGFSSRLALAFDWEYWMRISVYFDVAFVAQPLINWRIHSGSLTSQNVYKGGNTLSVRALREELMAKRVILGNHLPVIKNGKTLKRQVDQKRISRIVDRCENMLRNGGPDAEARKFILEMCAAFPEIVLSRNVWKVFLKSILNRRTIEFLKNASFL